jgi:hypothetical protein
MVWFIIPDDVIKEVIRIKEEELARSNDIIKVVHAVATLLGLDEKTLLQEVLKLEGCLVERCTRQDEALAVEDMVERVAEILSDHEAWDSYSSSKAPSAYKYATAVVLWLLLTAYHYGGLIRTDCPVFSDSVAAAIMRFLATRQAAPVAEALLSLSRSKRDNIASLCIYRS